MKSSKSAANNRKARVEELLTRGVDEVIEREHLKKALLSGDRKLRVKFGIDPTSPDIHIGHAVVLRKLGVFQVLGHKIVFIIGDFTARIGDPSGRSRERSLLTEKEVEKNMKKYLSQAGKIIDIKKAEIHYNSEWLGESVENILKLTRAGTIKQVLQREDFKKRIEKGLTILETLYPLFQGYDSVRIKADVELGGNDQLLNLLMGRQIQRHFGIPEQDIMTLPLLVGTDGTKKMSKSEGNYISLDDSPKEMFGKVMSIRDDIIFSYFELCTDVPNSEINKLRKLNPRNAKARLGREIVGLYHGDKKAEEAENDFDKKFRKKESPKVGDAIELTLKYPLRDVMYILAHKKVGLAASKSGARRLVEQGGVRINGTRITDPYHKTHNREMLEVGKKKTLIHVTYKK